MKVKVSLILLFSLFSFILSCDSNGKSLIRKTLENAIKSLPSLIKEVQGSEMCKLSKFKEICANGFKSPNSSTSARYIRGIHKDEETIYSFYDMLLQNLPIDQADMKKLKDILSTIEFASAVDTLGLSSNLLYNNKKNNNGCYFTIFEETNCEKTDEFDFLYTSITGLKLEDDIFLLEQGTGGLFSSTKEQVIVRNPSYISRDMYNTLITIFQIGAFENAIKLLDTIP